MTKEEALEKYEYLDGKLYLKHKSGCKRAGSEVGSLNTNGYLRTGKNKGRKYIHQIVFLMFNGYIPEYVDHIDGNRLNNRIENLREVTQHQNSWNTPGWTNSSSKNKGVSWCKTKKRWRARIVHNGHTVFLGYHKYEESAKLAYAKAEDNLRPEYKR
jgi:hypothetical protein